MTNRHLQNIGTWMQALTLLLVLTAATACRKEVKPDEREVVARIGEEVLLQETIRQVTFSAVDAADSARIADAYIRQWAEDVLFYEKARRALTPEMEQMVEDYRRSLCVHAYSEHLIEKKMNKQVPEDTLRQFFEENKQRFVLKENILKGVMLIVPKTSPNQEQLKKWLQKPVQNIEHIEKYAYQYATGYQLFTDQWTTDNQVLIRMPIERNEWNGQLSKGTLIEKSDSLSNYLLQVTDKHLAGEQMPYDYARGEIERIVLERRQVAFIQQQKADLYDDALTRLRLLMNE